MSSRLGVAVLALIALANVARADPGRPFVGALESTATTFSVTPEGLLHFEGTVAGRATLTGPITGTFAYDVNPADGTFAGTLTKVAANGDELHEAFVGRFNADFTASAGEFRIVDGTGRFARVAGGGQFAGQVTSPVDIAIRFDGRASVPD